MKLYLSGKMTGIENHNYPAFNAAAKVLREAGYEVVNPAETDADTTKEWFTYLKRDIVDLMGCEAVCVLPGWRSSKGASLEVHIAQTLGMPVYEYANGLGRNVADESICEEATRLVGGDRQGDYGHPLDDFTRTAKIWSAILGVDVQPEQVGLCMVGVKLSRQCNRPKRDNLVDGAGYFQTVDMVVRERERRHA